MTSRSQPIGLPGWRWATRIPTTALGTPMTSGTTPLKYWWDSSDSGITAAADTATRPPSVAAQVAGDARLPRASRSAGCMLRTERNATPRPFRKRYAA